MTGRNKGSTLGEACAAIGRTPVGVKNLQKALGLPRPAGEVYSAGYCEVLKRVVALRAFGVELDDIKVLLGTEKRIQELLNVDTLSTSPTWFIEHATAKASGKSDRLMLTGYNLGFSPEASAVQAGLNFGTRTQELFDGKEMGDDVRIALKGYVELRQKIMDRVARERPVLVEALKWANTELPGK